MFSSRCGRKRFSALSLSLISFLFVGQVFADQELSSTASAASTIITVGVSLFSLLALYVAFLTGSFLIKILKAAAKERKEAAHHGEGHGEPGKSALLPLIGWFFALFTLIALSVLVVGSLGISVGAEITYIRNPNALIIILGVVAFGGVGVYLFFLLLSAIWNALRGGRAEETHAAQGEALAGIPLNPELTRRSFLSLLGWAWVAFTAATMGALSTCLRFAFPNVTFEPPLKFAAGFPDTYAIGVDERFKDNHRAWIVRNEKGFYALSTICTHLGCTPNWLQAEQKFKCPCHGSGYYITGVNFEGPAPRPLERFQITLADDGQIVVDESVKFQQELGQWGMPGSFLEYKA